MSSWTARGERRDAGLTDGTPLSSLRLPNCSAEGTMPRTATRGFRWLRPPSQPFSLNLQRSSRRSAANRLPEALQVPACGSHAEGLCCCGLAACA